MRAQTALGIARALVLFGPVMVQVCWGAACVCADDACDSERQSRQQNPLADSDASDLQPYCGIRALFRALSAIDPSIPFAKLFRPEYVRREGSSVEQLEIAATDCGAYAKSLRGLTNASLHLLSSPTLLHVKSKEDPSSYNHWVLFMGFSGTTAVIYDGTQPAEYVPPEQLSTQWDGVAIIVSKSPIEVWDIYLIVVIEQFLYAAAAILALMLFRSFESAIRVRWPAAISGRWLYGALIGTLCIVTLAGGGCCMNHLITGRNPWADTTTIPAIRHRNRAQFIPRVARQMLKDALLHSDVLVIDARWEKDFATAHIPGAINIEPTSKAEKCRSIIGEVPSSRRLIVYCQSPSCPYSKKVAESLVDAGFGDIAIYEGGWVEWSSAE